MLRALSAVAVGALALAAVPAAATDGPELLEPCEAPAGATVLTTAGVSRPEAAPATPTSFGAARSFVVDLSGSPVGTRGDVLATLTWAVPANDYDLRVTLPGGEVLNSQNLQPVDEPLEEIAVGRLNHCSTFTVQVRNWVAPAVTDVPQLALSNKAVTPKV